MLYLTYNQSMIAHLCGSSPNTVSRIVASQQIESIELISSYNKRYDIAGMRRITDFVYASNKRPIYQKCNVFYNFKSYPITEETSAVLGHHQEMFNLRRHF